MTEASQEFVISIMSRDRVGIVYEISNAISELNGNIADVRQSVLCGYFTMILLASFPVGVTQRDIERKLAGVNAHSETAIDAAVKKGGTFASQSVGGLSGAFIPVCEDQALANAVRDGSLGLEKLEAMTSVCSVGLDMIAIPGSVDAGTIAAIIADEMVIGMINGKTTAVRLIPVPGKEAGEFVSFGGLFGESAIAPVRSVGKSARFVASGGKIPAPIHSHRN